MADPALYNAILEENKCLQSRIQEIGVQTALQTLNTNPTDTTLWSLIPLIDNPTGCLCVYNQSGDFRCGQCCLWTVPGGTTKVQFQIWGAGAGTGSGCCCGGSPFGATGSYATVIIDAVPGCQYTLCAGCAFCCYACRAQHTRFGCQSYVTGYDLSNFCALGGQAGVFRSMELLHGSTCCRYQAPNRTNSGACICNNGTDYCFSNSCATCGEIPWQPDPDFSYYGTSSTGTVYGLPSVHSKGCFETNHYGYFIHPPLISPCHTVQLNSCCCMPFDSGTCCGGCRCSGAAGVMRYPGGGGFATHMMGGATNHAGDAGRFGMVRVTWC